MTEHYYSHKPDVVSNPKFWDFTLKGRTFRFKSDNGVFSKKEVDFGSRLLVESFNLNEAVEGNILDVGCGYGPIGISIAAAYPDRTIEMIDINSRAVELSKENAASNGIANVNIYESDRFDKVASNQFAAILTNPPIRAGKSVVHEILEESYRSLVAGGELWVVIQKKQGASSAMDKMEQLFGNIEVPVKKKGYYILLSKKV
ncbi:class I SAM-dependent methyltransferase [Peribacillus frigoritolerans]|uniref:Class I SAM-dependent methyltransferase n=1 Tax=Peribacillus frigoritolerans TaxID=450367 RepID=A0AAJ1QIM7_9BACI|nr:class I SAM-dependent methyltransferase [Peribacillus frigoritolerans]MDM5282077.1 class I SAM-dependent methyltransferase [Peribacillus frigoritolerans]